MTLILELAGTSYNCDKTRNLGKDQVIFERSLTELPWVVTKATWAGLPQVYAAACF